MARCGCGSGTGCGCSLINGSGTTVTGSGTPQNPWQISATTDCPQVLACIAANDVTAQSFNTNSTDRSAFFKTTSPTDHAVTIYQASTTGRDVAVALNVISDNRESSAMYLSGHELDRGTFKVTHTNGGTTPTADASAAAISIDLRRGTNTGTAAQGIFLTATEGPTTGSLITLRNSDPATTEDFAVRWNGKTGIRIPVGNTPQGSLEVRQKEVGDVGLVVVGAAGATAPIAQFKNSGNLATFEIGASGAIVTRAVAFLTSSLQLGATSTDFGGAVGVVMSMKNVTTAPTTNPTGGGILYAEGGSLRWRGPNGTVTTIAPA